MTKRNLYHFLIGLFFFLSFFSHSQSQVSDSLRKALANCRTPAGRINTYVVIARECTDYDSAVKYANLGLEFCEKQSNKYGLAYILCSMGKISADHSQLSEGIKWCNRAIIESTRISNDTLIARSYLSRGGIYYSMADYLNSTTDYHTSLKYSERAGNKKMIGATYNLLGLNFSVKKPSDNVRSMEYYRKAEKIDREIHSMRDLGFVLLRMGWNYLGEKKKDSALIYLDEAMRIGDSLNIPEVQKWTLEAFADMYRKEKNYDKALQVFSKSLQISIRTNDMSGIVNSSLYMSSIYKTKVDFNKAMFFCDSAIRICERHKIYSALHTAYRVKSGIFEEMGKDKEALKFFKRCIKLKDSLFKKENSENLNELEKKYETEKKEKELFANKSELRVQKADNERQQFQRNGFIIGTVLLFFFSIFIFRGYKQKKKASELIALQKKEVESQKFIIEEKQKEVMDSINYAKRIQKAHLPSEKYISRKLTQLKKK